MMFKDQIECYQAIGAALAKAAPPNWIKIDTEVALDGDRVDAIVSYVLSNNAAGHLSGVPMLARYFYELARLVSSEEKGLFRSCVFNLHCDGKYDTEFTY